MLQALRLGKRKPITLEWNALSSGNTTSSQFLNNQSSAVAPSTTEQVGQTPAPLSFYLWRFQAAFTVTGNQQATLTVRVNGISQASTATVVGAAAGAVNTDLTSAIAINVLDPLGVLFTTPANDAVNTRPRGVIFGAARSSL